MYLLLVLIPSVCTPFHYFYCFTPLSMNSKFNFGLNFNTISLFHLNCEISFGFLPIKEKSSGLLELASKITEI